LESLVSPQGVNQLTPNRFVVSPERFIYSPLMGFSLPHPSQKDTALILSLVGRAYF